MSDFDNLEQSRTDSAPVECYKFVGAFKTYRYTSSETRVFVGGEWYEPIPLKRGTIKAGTQNDDNLNVEVTMPFDAELVLDYAYAVTPPTLDVDIIRAQSGGDLATDYEVFWKGRVRGFKINGRLATIIIPSIFSLALQGELPNYYYQAVCNHVLYDDGCKVDRAANTVTTTVQSVGDLTVSVIGEPGSAGTFAAGELVNTRNGERRLILSNVGSTITVGYPFVDLLPGDEVEVSKGCDHAFTSANGCPKFANQINFGGFPYIPPDNPFEGEL